MITFHEIKGIIQKMATLSGHIRQLNELLPQVVLLSERIDSLNEDLTLERDRMTAKIRSVEVLGEILRTHVYQSDHSGSYHPADDAVRATGRVTTDGEPSASESAAKPTDSQTATGAPGQSGLYRTLDGSSMIL